MANMDFEACYRALELPFGAGLKEINERWRKLSRIHHPDRHARNPKNYQIALEKQKQLNNARDILKKWFETNPYATPPRSTSGSQQTQHKSANANTSNNNANKSQSNNTNSQTQQGTQSKHQSHASQNQRQTNSQRRSSTSSQGPSAKPPNTGWFAASELKLTPMQDLVEKIDKHCCRGTDPSFVGMILAFAAIFGPLFVISGTLGSIFPELLGHYPDWLMMTMLAASGWCTCYIFRWFFAEAELIKLQQREMYFRSGRSLSDTVDLAKSIIEKHTVPNGSWKFAAAGAAHEATLNFEEEVFPDVKRSRCLKIRFEARPGTYTVVFAMQVKASSPVNSFSCKQVAEKVLADLKNELEEIAA